jgi:hypothetical protein
VEIGSHHPINTNNTYILEKDLNWNGIMIEKDMKFKNLYQKYRKKSNHVFNDATKIDYLKLFQNLNTPNLIDYLQIDLEVTNGSTLNCLKNLEKTFEKHKFAVITFEHDIYTDNATDNFNTRKISREIFEKHGYYPVFLDISNNNSPYEDWYVHPDLVNMNYIKKL